MLKFCFYVSVQSYSLHIHWLYSILRGWGGGRRGRRGRGLKDFGCVTLKFTWFPPKSLYSSTEVFWVNDPPPPLRQPIFYYSPLSWYTLLAKTNCSSVPSSENHAIPSKFPAPTSQQIKKWLISWPKQCYFFPRNSLNGDINDSQDNNEPWFIAYVELTYHHCHQRAVICQSSVHQ